MTKEQIDMQEVVIFSDYICPFCFIGAQRAALLAAELAVRITWRGFEIHPEVPPEGVPLEQFMPAAVSNLEARVRALAEEAGLSMRMPAKLSNSHLALLGAEYARDLGALEEYHEAIFRAYFQESKDIGDIETLVDIWNGINDDSVAFREALASDKYESVLEASAAAARSLGITGVPTFVFADGAIVVGAQPYSVLKNAAEKTFRRR
jgi:predicted DsbA family dithiol-disulfide isomerase